MAALWGRACPEAAVLERRIGPLVPGAPRPPRVALMHSTRGTLAPAALQARHT